MSAPGLRAIKAVLLLDENDSMLVSDAVRDCGTSKASIRKYRELISALNSQHESSILAGGSANPFSLSPPSSETDHTSRVRPFYCPFGVALFRNRDCLLLCAWTGYWFEQVVWLLVGGVRVGRVAASGEDPSGVSTLQYRPRGSDLLPSQLYSPPTCALAVRPADDSDRLRGM